MRISNSKKGEKRARAILGCGCNFAVDIEVQVTKTYTTTAGVPKGLMCIPMGEPRTPETYRYLVRCCRCHKEVAFTVGDMTRVDHDLNEAVEIHG